MADNNIVIGVNGKSEEVVVANEVDGRSALTRPVVTSAASIALFTKKLTLDCVASLRKYYHHDRKSINLGDHHNYFAGRCHNSGDHVLLKELVVSKSWAYIEENVWKEIKLLRTLQHKNIVRLLKVCKDDHSESIDEDRKFVYLVFENYSTSLATLLAVQVPLHISYCNMVVQELLSALVYVHRQGYIHGNVQPSNVMIRKDGHIMLSGFDKVVHLDEVSMRQNKGKALYTPLEYFCGTKFLYLCPTTDMWSVGCVMYELLTLKPLFGDGKLHHGREKCRRAAYHEFYNNCFNTTDFFNPSVSLVSYAREVKDRFAKQLQDHVIDTIEDPMAVQLLLRMLHVSLVKRITSWNAKADKYFEKCSNSTWVENKFTLDPQNTQ